MWSYARLTLRGNVDSIQCEAFGCQERHCSHLFFLSSVLIIHPSNSGCFVSHGLKAELWEGVPLSLRESDRVINTGV